MSAVHEGAGTMGIVAAWSQQIGAGGRVWRIEQQWTDEGVALSGEVAGQHWQGTWNATATLRVRNGCDALFSAGARAQRLPWSVSRSMPSHAMETDVLGAFIGRLVGKDASRPYRSIAGIPSQRQPLVSLGHDVAARLYGLCDPAATRATRRFPTESRFALLRQFDLDATGRLLEKVADAPGVLLLLIALEAGDANSVATASRLRAALQAGSRLDRAIDEALEAHLAQCVTAPPTSHVDTRARPAYLYVHGLQGKARAFVMKRWRLLVRRARPHVAPRILLRPPPVDFAPEDIPHGLAENARWYACMASDDALSSPQTAGGFEVAAALSRYVACHGWRFLLPGMASFALDFVRERPAFDVRRYGPARTRELFIEALTERSRRLSVSTSAPLPPPPIAGVRQVGLEIWPLDTPALLVAESETQGHCARTYEPRVRRRESYLYGARVGVERLTVELALGIAGGWSIVQVRGRSNALPSNDALVQLSHWCATDGAVPTAPLVEAHGA